MALTKVAPDGKTYEVGSPEYNQAFGINPQTTYTMRGIGGGTGNLNTSISPTQRASQQSIADWYKANGMDVNNGGALDDNVNHSPWVPYSGTTQRSAGGARDYADMYQRMQAGQVNPNPFASTGGQNPWGSVSNNFSNPMWDAFAAQANPYGQAGGAGGNGMSPLANQLMQYTGYQNQFPNQYGDQSHNVLDLNTMLNPQTGQGIGLNHGGAGGGLPNYFGHGWGQGIGSYGSSVNENQLGALGGLEQLGGMGGDLANRLNSLYDSNSWNIGNLTADYLEFAAPRFAQGWNLYGMSPAMEGLLNTRNQNPYQYQNPTNTVQPFTQNPGIANAYPILEKYWDEGKWQSLFNPIQQGLGGLDQVPIQA